ncbi:MFS transporter [Leucobacter aridicollis]|uniref:MFS transporter n=1 Tax=Leucobacter aridicollis TaxID=283878 RepID=UPI002169B5AC|nr:MFS transporter [Leucobacter aridicollis]MCS3428346.1 putative MFS family arabinose efflux permease [Leucobacter aridicollis]
MNSSTLPARVSAGHPMVSVGAITLSTFLVVTSEMMPVGVLTPMAASLGVTAGGAGATLTVTGAIAAVVSTFAPALAARVDRRTILIAFMIVLAVANALTAVAPTYAVVMLGRVLLGVAMGMVWGLAAGLGGRIAPPSRSALATTLIFSGVSIASVLGVPLGTSVGGVLGWRSAFWLLAALSVVAAIGLRLAVPALPADSAAGFRGIFSVLRVPQVVAGLAITALLVVGHFTGYTFIRPVLEFGVGAAEGGIAAALLVFGIAGVVGNFAVGGVAALRPKRAVVGTATTLALGVAGVSALSLLGTAGFGQGTGQAPASIALVAIAIWGLGYGGVSVATQRWIATAEPGQVEASAALWAGIFNASIAVGAVLGGAAFDGSGAVGTLAVALGIAATGVLVAALTSPRVPR